MLKLTQELFGAPDPDMRRKGEEGTIGASTIMDFFAYSTKMTAERRAPSGRGSGKRQPNGKVKGCPLGDLKRVLLLIVATAGHDTKSSTIAGLARADRKSGPAGEAQGQSHLLSSAVDEMIR